jgi:signal transduction histidine kinase
MTPAHHLDDLGLLPALQFLAEGWPRVRGCIRVDSVIEGRLALTSRRPLPDHARGITNITKHAAATHVELQLRRDAQIVHGLLQDDGVGFAIDRVMNPEGSRGLGLLGIQERLGALAEPPDHLGPRAGPTLQITVPVEPWEASSEADRLCWYELTERRQALVEPG